MVRIENRPSLHNQLALLKSKRAEIPWEKWGKGDAKGIFELAREIRNGETVLSIGKNGELQRTVDKARVIVTHKDKILVEKEQIYNNGRVRKRGRSYVSEKRKPGQTFTDTAVRGLEEELVLPIDKKRLLKGKKKKRTAPSTTYPGIKEIKKTKEFALVLTDAEFAGRKNGHTEVQANKKVIFEWQKIKSELPVVVFNTTLTPSVVEVNTGASFPTSASSGLQHSRVV